MDKKPDRYGLFHSLEHLGKMKEMIAFAPVKEQAKYADYVCVAFTNDRRINENVLSKITIEKLYEWNATSVGNTAYIALNSKNSNIRKSCLRLLDIYKEFVMAKMLKNTKTLEESIKTFNGEIDKFKEKENEEQ